MVSSLVMSTFLSREADQQFHDNFISLLNMLAEAGNEKAQTLLGLYYRDGFGNVVPVDAREAVFWPNKAAERGNREAAKYIEEIDID